MSRKIPLLLLLALTWTTYGPAFGKIYKTSEIYCRDPFIYVDRAHQCYYLMPSAGASPEGRLAIYRSTDLQQWEMIGRAVKETGIWQGAADWWAPDTYEWKGKYYVFVTVSKSNEKRGTMIFRSDNGVTGDYLPVRQDVLTITPRHLQSLDGALFVDQKGRPWMLYCHEWLECYDGEVMAQRLKKDLSGTIGKPIKLFSASEAPWCMPIEKRDGHDCYVTDAPYIIRDEQTGHLIMLWSSFARVGEKNKYVFAQAISASGRLEGPWVQDFLPLNVDDGGHTMLFRDLNGEWRVSYHSPNSVISSTIRPTLTIGRVKIENGRISAFEK